MPGTILVAATATGVQPPYALFVGGTNVLKNTNGGNDFGTPLGSIEIVEAGPGGVSSCDFSIDDPLRVIGLADGQGVLFWDFVAGVPLFQGFVDHWSSTPAFGQGQTYQVSCAGVEAWLDRIVVYPAYVINTAINLPGNIVNFVNSLGTPLRAIFGSTSTFATPVGALGPADTNTGVQAGTIPAGSTLREGLKMMLDRGTSGAVGSGQGVDASLTVDFSLGLRAWANWNNLSFPIPSLSKPTDYTTLTVTDTTAGAIVAEDLEFAVEPGDPVHEVYVIGGSAAGSGLFGDGTGVRGRQGSITDAAILTYDDALIRATNFLASQGGLIRGSFSLSDFTPAATIHAGSLLNLTDANLGIAPPSGYAQYRIMEIRKRFTGARQTWEVAFGGMPPSAARLIRKLTRAVAA